MKPPIRIYVVDNDQSIRQALEMLFLSADLDVLVFESVKEFIETDFREENTCLVVDSTVKDISNPEFQLILKKKGAKIPVIFISTDDSESQRQKLKQAGVVGCFTKPVDDQALLDTIYWALSKQESSNNL